MAAALASGCSRQKSMECVIEEAFANAERQALVLAGKYAG